MTRSLSIEYGFMYDNAKFNLVKDLFKIFFLCFLEKNGSIDM